MKLKIEIHIFTFSWLENKDLSDKTNPKLQGKSNKRDTKKEISLIK